jgi:hypothetical protein
MLLKKQLVILQSAVVVKDQNQSPQISPRALAVT